MASKFTRQIPAKAVQTAKILAQAASFLMTSLSSHESPDKNQQKKYQRNGDCFWQDDGQLLVRVGHVIFSQQFPGFIDQSMQCQHLPGAEHCVQALLGDLPMAACLIAFLMTHCGDGDAAATRITASTKHDPAGIDQRLEVARERRSANLHAFGQITRPHRPQFKYMAQQRILGGLEPRLDHLGVIVLCHPAHQLTQAQIGTAQRFQRQQIGG